MDQDNLKLIQKFAETRRLIEKLKELHLLGVLQIKDIDGGFRLRHLYPGYSTTLWRVYIDTRHITVRVGAYLQPEAEEKVKLIDDSEVYTFLMRLEVALEYILCVSRHFHQNDSYRSFCRCNHPESRHYQSMDSTERHWCTLCSCKCFEANEERTQNKTKKFELRRGQVVRIELNAGRAHQFSSEPSEGRILKVIKDLENPHLLGIVLDGYEKIFWYNAEKGVGSWCHLTKVVRDLQPAFASVTLLREPDSDRQHSRDEKSRQQGNPHSQENPRTRPNENQRPKYKSTDDVIGDIFGNLAEIPGLILNGESAEARRRVREALMRFGNMADNAIDQLEKIFKPLPVNKKKQD